VAITEERRHKLYQDLVQLLGQEGATTLMEHLPPTGWADVATKRDLDRQSLVTRRDLEVESARLRGEMAAGFAGVRDELASVRAGMSAGLADVRAEIAAVEVRFERALREQSRTYFLGMLTANATLAGLAFAAAQLV
jgi:hypothetical protein